jgi:hypothetical protein
MKPSDRMPDKKLVKSVVTSPKRKLSKYVNGQNIRVALETNCMSEVVDTTG